MLRIATRKSALALWQARRVQELLGDCELLPMSTEGDRILDRSLAEAGGKGLFVKELERALADGRADLAVHSAKDVPFAIPEELVLSAFMTREDPRDALIAKAARGFADLPRGARVGTSSLRRAMQLRAARPDLEIVAVRGNVQTRLSKATSGELDAVVLALAGLKRLGLDGQVTEILPIELSLPAAGQGALAIETLRGSRGHEAVQKLNDAESSTCVRAERAVLERLAGGCTVPVAAFAVLEPGGIWLRSVLGGPTGENVQILRAEARGTDPETLGRGVADSLLAQGGAALLEAARLHIPGLPPPKKA
ncbi:MAG TPA: hydroxymethylbilane synthase [Myxococcales bacterium]|nr:hydroxymethylbilane synthase [Myxococcales bacterium]